MPISESKYIWRNGELILWEQAITHVLSHGLNYGTSVFEGIRSYQTKDKGVCIFRNEDHFKRFKYSANVYRMSVNYSVEVLASASKTLLQQNGLTNAYIRPLAYLGYGEMGPESLDNPTEIILAAYASNGYAHGDECMEKGIDVAVSSWRRPAPGTIPAGVKAGGNYLSSRLIGLEALENGFHDGIGLSHDGTVSEGKSSNIFIVQNKKILTPPSSASILTGITRDTVMKLAAEAGYDVNEQSITREMLYAADEVFLTGTVSEITPVRTIDRLLIGTGNHPITKNLQDLFFGLFSGSTPDQFSWLSPIDDVT